MTKLPSPLQKGKAEFGLRQSFKTDFLHERGQALLIVLLTMAVTLTVVLSVVSRSITDISVTTYEEEALRAFSAAEAGIEEALLETTVGDQPEVEIEPGVTYDSDVTEHKPSSTIFRNPKDLVSGEVATLWLASRDTNGNFVCNTSGGQPCFRGNIVSVCWGDSTSVRTAVEVMFYYDVTRHSLAPLNNYSAVKVKRFAFDPNSRGGFSPPNGGPSCDTPSDTYAYRSQININNDIDSNCDNTEGCPLLVKARIYYTPASDPQKIAFRLSGSPANVPSQGFQIDSTGKVAESERRINVFEGFARNPYFFDAAVFSAKDLVKN